MIHRRRLGLGWVGLLLLLVLACNLPTSSSSNPPDEGPPPTIASVVRGKATATTAPTQTPTDTPMADLPPADNGACTQPDVAYGDVGLCYDPAVASSAVATVIPAGEEDVLFGEMWAFPERVRFDFSGYASRSGDWQPDIVVYPTAMLEAANPQAAEIVAEIRSLLDTKPVPNAIQGIPIMPPVNAAQIYRARLAYRDGGNARGLRFLTQYAQDVTPVVNESLVYVWEGFIGDGRQYVMAWLPVSHPTLREAWSDYTNDEMDLIYNDYENYLNEALANLEMQPADSFVPSLDLLDEMMLSLQVRGNE